MTYSSLRSFHAVARDGSFAAAARSLNLSQSTLSTQVKELESRYGVELFHRQRRGAQLTETGRSLFTITRRMFAGEQEAYEFLSAVSGLQAGHLKVGAVGPNQASEILALLKKRYAKLDLSVSFGNSRQVQNDILSYHTDVGILGAVEIHPDLFAIEYSRPEIVVVVNKRHPLSRRRKIRIEELEGRRLVQREAGSETRRAFEEAISRAGVRLDRAIQTGSREGMFAAVALDMGIGAVSEEDFLPHPSLRKVRVSNAEIYTHVHVVCLAERKDGHLIQPFLKVVEDLILERDRPR